MSAEDNMIRRGIHVGGEVRYRKGLGPKLLEGVVLTVLSRSQKGKIEVSDSESFGRIVGRDWHSKFEPVTEARK